MAEPREDMVVEALTNAVVGKTKKGSSTCKFDAMINGERATVCIWNNDIDRLPGNGNGVVEGVRVHGKFSRKDDYNGKAQYFCTPKDVEIPDGLRSENAPAAASSGSSRAASRQMNYGRTVNFVHVTFGQMVQVVRRASRDNVDEGQVLDVACRLTNAIYISWQNGYVNITEPQPSETGLRSSNASSADDGEVDVKGLLSGLLADG